MSLITVTLLLSIYFGYLDYRRHGNSSRAVYIPDQSTFSAMLLSKFAVIDKKIWLVRDDATIAEKS